MNKSHYLNSIHLQHDGIQSFFCSLKIKYLQQTLSQVYQQFVNTPHQCATSIMCYWRRGALYDKTQFSAYAQQFNC